MASSLIRKSDNGHGELHQGGAKDVIEAGDAFNMIVLCAEEFPAERVQGLLRPKARLISAPNDDDPTRPLSRAQIMIAARAAREVERAYRRGERVLVSCFMGWNRSGLVSAIALHFLTGAPGKECVEMVRKGRNRALSNPRFVEFLEKIPERRRG